jgi:hypothetical protein
MPEDYDPRILYSDDRDFKNVARIRYHSLRRQDPEHQREIRRAIERIAHSPEEAEELGRTVAALERERGAVRPKPRQNFRYVYGSLSRPYAATSYPRLESPPKTLLFGAFAAPPAKTFWPTITQTFLAHRGRPSQHALRI